MDNTVRQYLIEVSRRRTNQTITYRELSDLCNLNLYMGNQNDRNELASILEVISTYEHSHGRPLLSSLVLCANDGKEGDGFYKLAERLGYGYWQRLKREGLFDVQQIKACIDFWQVNSNYSKYY